MPLVTKDGFTVSRNIIKRNGNFTLGADNKLISLVATNFDVYGTTNYNDGELVFQLPTLKKTTTLAPVIQREKTKGTLQETLTEILVVLPLIIVVVVSLVGLRKALKMLSMLLRRS